jgi:hypothetical protein
MFLASRAFRSANSFVPIPKSNGCAHFGRTSKRSLWCRSFSSLGHRSDPKAKRTYIFKKLRKINSPRGTHHAPRRSCCRFRASAIHDGFLHRELLRAKRWRIGRTIFSSIDDATLKAWETINFPFDTPQLRSLACLPTCFGGIGLRELRAHCGVAFIASVVAAADLSRLFWKNTFGFIFRALPTHGSSSQLRILSSPSSPPSLKKTTRYLEDAVPMVHGQRMLSRDLDATSFDDLLPQLPEELRARLICAKAPLSPASRTTPNIVRRLRAEKHQRSLRHRFRRGNRGRARALPTGAAARHARPPRAVRRLLACPRRSRPPSFPSRRRICDALCGRWGRRMTRAAHA